MNVFIYKLDNIIKLSQLINKDKNKNKNIIKKTNKLRSKF